MLACTLSHLIMRLGSHGQEIKNTVLTACPSDSKLELLEDLPLLLIMTVFLPEANWVFYPHLFSARVKLTQRSWSPTSLHSLILISNSYLLSTLYILGTVLSGRIQRWRAQTQSWPSQGSQYPGKWGVGYRKWKARILPVHCGSSLCSST